MAIKPLADKVVVKTIAEENKTETGIFGADMKVSLTNDGPVTIMLER